MRVGDAELDRIGSDDEAERRELRGGDDRSRARHVEGAVVVEVPLVGDDRVAADCVRIGRGCPVERHGAGLADGVGTARVGDRRAVCDDGDDVPELGLSVRVRDRDGLVSRGRRERVERECDAQDAMGGRSRGYDDVRAVHRDAARHRGGDVIGVARPARIGARIEEFRARPAARAETVRARRGGAAVGSIDGHRRCGDPRANGIRRGDDIRRWRRFELDGPERPIVRRSIRILLERPEGHVVVGIDVGERVIAPPISAAVLEKLIRRRAGENDRLGGPRAARRVRPEAPRRRDAGELRRGGEGRAEGHVTLPRCRHGGIQEPALCVARRRPDRGRAQRSELEDRGGRGQVADLVPLRAQAAVVSGARRHARRVGLDGLSRPQRRRTRDLVLVDRGGVQLDVGSVERRPRPRGRLVQQVRVRHGQGDGRTERG